MSDLKKLISLAKANDKEATRKLLEMYYFDACKWASKFLTKVKHSNLIQFEYSEVDSLVFIAFVNSIRRYSLDRERVQSFKNFFYQMIKYQAFEEFRTMFNWQVIPDYIKLIKMGIRIDESYLTQEERLDNKNKCAEIIVFLEGRCKLYAEIFSSKLLGFSNDEICEKLKITKSTLKSTNQYIKKLIREKFGKSGEFL